MTTMIVKSCRKCACALVACFCLLLVGDVAAQSPSSNDAADKGSSSARAAGANPDLLHQFSDSIEKMVARVAPAVVQIVVTGYGAQEEGRKEIALVTRQRAIGSGIIVDPSGYIMTNAHVVAGEQRIQVILPAPPGDTWVQTQDGGVGKILQARLVGIHSDSDLALLKIDVERLPFLNLNALQPIRQGQLVFAIGSPEGLENTVTMGIISSPSRQPDPDNPMVYVQTDAPINPGNSGGPLVDIDGNLVGINTMILSQGGGSEGLGFAIPAAIVHFDYRSLRKYGHVHRAEIGAGIQSITPQLAAGLGLERSWGAIISDVAPDGPAAAAGLKIGDIVLAIDDRTSIGLPGLTAALYRHALDRPLKMRVLRGNQEVALTIPVLEHQDEFDQLADTPDFQKNLVTKLGIFATDITEKLRELLPALEEETGVVVVAQAAGPAPVSLELQTGDIIRALNRIPVASLQQLRSGVDALKPGDPVVLQVERAGKLRYLATEMEQ
jgi:serine protease Do